jgi:hypothetical protein
LDSVSRSARGNATYACSSLTEAAVLTGIGGALGAATGSLLAKTLIGLFDWPTDLDAATAMLPFVFGGLTGVFFG